MRNVTYSQKNIVILGSGFGGLTAARILGRALKKQRGLRETYDVVLVNREETHTYTPGLYEVATLPKEDATPIELKRTTAIPITHCLRGLPVRFIQDEVVGVNVEDMRVTLRDGGTLHAEYLLLALGAVTNDFGIPGVREHGMALKTFTDALLLRGAAEKLLRQKNDAHILVAGGGATGVELAGELMALARHIRKKFREMSAPRLTVIDAGPRLLPGPPKRVARAVHKRLERFGVKIRLNAKLTAVDAREAVVRLPDNTEERMPFDLFVWSGGIKPPPLLEAIVVPKDARGRCMVDPNLTIHGHDRILAIGDLTCFGDAASGKPLPATAYVAIAEGKIAARNILAQIHGKAMVHFHPPARPPIVVPVSGKWAVAYISGVVFSGFPVFFLRLAIDLRYFLRVMPPITAVRFFFYSTMMYFRNDS